MKNYFRIAKALDLKLSDLIKEYEDESNPEYNFALRRGSVFPAGNDLFEEESVSKNLKNLLGEASSISIKMVSVNIK